MTSGTPVLTTRLPGMPEEYAEYVFMIDGSGSEGVTAALAELFALPSDELVARGLAAQNFVVNSKNNVVQSRRILDFAQEI
jgi:glycosyltransferase involved in cell wall biosynthesis